ncbi:MAG: hypothetical protein N3B12_08195 [Armatimonadetes bacterium]|nr:hypothetical protein [Armatimonadota bacterium]
MSVLTKLQNIDRRILYLLIAVVIAVPLLRRPSKHPSVVFLEVKNAYNTLDRIPKNKVVILSTVWGPGTRAENESQTEAIMRHLFRNRTKFVVLSWDQLGSQLTYDGGTAIAKKMGRRYGADWVHLGYNPGPMYAIIRGLGKNFPGVFKVDRFGKKLKDIPLTAKVRDHRDIGAVVEITPSGTVAYWIAYFNQPYQVPLVFCPTAVMSAEAYPYLDSGQLNGMLNGVIGAAQYETLIGMGKERTYAAAASWALSSAHIFILVLIVLGNLGYALSRRSTRARGGSKIG